MTESPTHIERIEAFHEGRMDEAQRKDFEIQLLVDLQLQQENDAYLRVRQAFRDRKEKEIRSRFHQIDQELERPAPTGIRALHRSWRIAAAFLLVIGAAWILKLAVTPTVNSTDDLFPDEPGLPVLMGKGTDHKEFDQAMSVFQAGEFSQAAGRFDVLYQVNPSNDTLAYFLALSMLRQRQGDVALSLFSRLASGHSCYKAKSVYYQALAQYLIDGDAEKMEVALKNISSDPAHPLSGFSSQVLDRLSSH